MPLRVRSMAGRLSLPGHSSTTAGRRGPQKGTARRGSQKGQRLFFCGFIGRFGGARDPRCNHRGAWLVTDPTHGWGKRLYREGREDAKARRTNRPSSRLGVFAVEPFTFCCCCSFCDPLRRPFLRPLRPAVVEERPGRGAGIADGRTGNSQMTRACVARARIIQIAPFASRLALRREPREKVNKGTPRDAFASRGVLMSNPRRSDLSGTA